MLILGLVTVPVHATPYVIACRDASRCSVRQMTCVIYKWRCAILVTHARNAIVARLGEVYAQHRGGEVVYSVDDSISSRYSGTAYDPSARDLRKRTSRSPKGAPRVRGG